MEQEPFSNLLGWIAVVLFWISSCLATYALTRPPVTRPSGVLTALLVMADVSNLSGTVLGQAPRWQMAVAMLFILQDLVNTYCIIAFKSSTSEVTSRHLKRACVVIFLVAMLFVFQGTLRQATTRELAIEMGIISALSNISARLWRMPKPTPPSLHNYLAILGQLFYSTAILTHPDRLIDGQSYLEENAPWVIGSLVPALLEYSTVAELSTRHRKEKFTLV
eukprot:TRINITY_DN16853_c0_g1_i1.p1 TRINITY_DN16853_c0_g1~~TRINITY_DN16853_c0_g1_i1.p1  ORF type:complete len:221 (+),score=15.40 TRINITY_DN16853_c0_g1_i1:58-720(+)